MKDKHPQPKSPPKPINYAWLDKRFDDLEHQHAVILDRIKEVKDQTSLILARLSDVGVTTELAAAIVETARRAKAIDEKVPDAKFIPQTKPPTSDERTLQ